MAEYLLLDTFTLIPKDLYSPQLGKEALAAQFMIDMQQYNFGEWLFGDAKAMVAYAIPKSEGEKLPLIARLLEETRNIASFNKVILHYCPKKQLSNTVICMGGELKLANSYKADSFESALYFLFLAIQKLQMNPQQCTVRVTSEISGEQHATIARFFKGTEIYNLNNTLE